MALFVRRGRRAALERDAVDFVRQFHAETGGKAGDEGGGGVASGGGALEARLAEVREEIRATGTYRHTGAELAFGARVAWRNSNRCIGRLYWRGLRVRDRRHVRDAAGIAAECVRHLDEAGNGGRIRPLITVFAPDAPDRPGPRLWNDQLVRYAGHVQPDGSVVGDPRNVPLTEAARALGWTGAGTSFDPLPLLVDAPDEPVRMVPLPERAVLEVELSHPDFPWFADLGLRWHAVPAVCDMTLEIGGLTYPCAPFSGWYMGTEIGARNLADADRYDLLPRVAERLGLDTRREASLWRDRALVELNVAVLHSFRAAGVTMTDHHTESRRFLAHVDREESAGRRCPADWTWIVPPLSGAATPVFHRYYHDDADVRPNFVRRENPLPVPDGEHGRAVLVPRRVSVPAQRTAPWDADNRR
ncbi:nitric oxide synthase oxygenase [Actinomadura rupiterrae]|uniref:nitric oxide synthase oxygenase n=1 Tax=Actinomadura rupiterrae TaxID=559627 RepID=UPI0020A30F96|nr:nitric oxide synthase oxygenase [Actinomadura rupiterrae]MCP2338137.1 nitric-oxide synthase [Actinomadura rupiterrae]